MDPINPPANPQGELLKRELQRRSLDKIMVHNTTSEDFSFEYDGYLHTVKAGEKRVFERYLAVKFARDLKNKIIHEMGDNAVKERKAALEKAGVPAGNIPYQANEELQSKYRTDNPELVKEIYDKVWLGIVEKYGATAARSIEEERKANQVLTVEEQALQGMDKPYVETAKNDAKPAQTEDLKLKKDEAIGEIAK